MKINSESNSLQILKAMQESQKELKDSTEKLSSGSSINKASDNPAGLVVSEKMRAQIAALGQELENLDNTNNKLTTADGDLATMQSSLQEMRNVALAAANEGGNSKESQQSYQENLNNAVESYNQTVENSAYGTQQLFDGTSGSVADLEKMANLDVSTPEKAEEAVAAIDQKIQEVSETRADIGATQKAEISTAKNNVQTAMANLTASESTVSDTDMAKEYVNIVKNEMQLKASTAMLAQQNQIPNLVLNFLQSE